jgi:hypothetical protein
MRTQTQNLDNLYTTTFQNRQKGIIDNIFTSTPFWYMMTKNGRNKASDGGAWIEIALRYGKNETIKAFGKNSTFDIVDDEYLTVAQYNMRFVGGSISRSWVDEQKNKGKSQIINAVNDKIDTLEMSMIDKMEEYLFADGTGDGGLAPDGLGNLIAESPITGTVGNINRATYSWWRNNYKDMASEEVSVYLKKRMATMFNDCGQQGDGVSRFPDLLVTAQNVYEAYESEVAELQQIVSTGNGVGDLGFGDMKYKGRAITWAPSCPAGSIYFINTNFLNWMYDPIAQFDMTDWKEIPNQYKDRVAQVALAGNLVGSNFKRQGVIFNITP